MLRIPARTLFASSLALCVAAAPFQAAHAQSTLRSRIDTTLAFNKGAWVDVGLISGDIIITGWTRPEAQISAHVQDGDLESSISASRISIHTRSRRRRLGEARYELHVPIGTRVQASSISGDIRVTATAGEVQVNATSGAVEIIDATDRVSVSTVSGDIHLSRIRANTRIHTTSGDLEIDDVTGDLSIQSVSTDMRLRRIKSSRAHIETVNGSITYEGGIDAAGSYDFSTHSGDVVLKLPSSIGATLDLQTFSGDISSSFPLTLQPGERSRSKSGRKMQFTIGSGGARITAQTFSGDITIERNGRSNPEE